MHRDDDAACPCGSGNACGRCCGRFIGGAEYPVTAEQLMRSRYTAYVRSAADYLLDTWHVSGRPAHLDLDEPVTWLGLRILRTEGGRAGDAEGLVEFVARYRVGGNPAGRLHESSRFVREGVRWVYLGADPGDGGDAS